MPHFSHNDYTIGWICALHIEFAAATALFDDEHPDLPPHPGDTNAYSLGRIGRHNVVVAVLPAGKPGTSPAAIAAAHLVRSFPQVRFGLMVGIGGGVPVCEQAGDEGDIRLGDVVVSQPYRQYNGVVQYDSGRLDDGEFILTGSINHIPTAISTAVNKLRARAILEGYAIQTTVQEIAKKCPRARFTRLENTIDRLFQASSKHVGRPGKCIDCVGLVQRDTRIPSDEVVVHYGLIGSADKLVRDPVKRDQLRDQFNIKCLEMEAAGLPNDFPCLVIRGISDYCDTHKNDNWHNYAAATAAAYAKELLGCVEPQSVEIEQLAYVVMELKDIIVELPAQLDRITGHQDDQKRSDLLNWLSPDYAFQHDSHVKARISGTCLSFIESPEYLSWIDTACGGEALHLLGMPGTGKTILASSIIADLQARSGFDNTNGLCYHYYDYRREDDQSLEKILRWFLRQLCSIKITDVVKELHERHRSQNTQPDLATVKNTLRCMMLCFKHVYVVVDALDECSSRERHRKDILSELSELNGLTGLNVHVLITSRSQGDIPGPLTLVKSIEIKASNQDIEKFIISQIPLFRAFVSRRPDLQQRIIQAIVSAVDGIFLHAKLHVEAIKNTNSEHELLTTLDSTCSSGHEAAYRTTMERIYGQSGSSKQLAIDALTWTVFAERALTVAELLHALATEVGASRFYETATPDIADVISFCCGLLMVEPETRLVRLIHQTTEDFLKQHGSIWLDRPHTRLSNICNTYLALNIATYSGTGNAEIRQKHFDRYPFYEYAFSHAELHARYREIAITADELVASQACMDEVSHSIFDGYIPEYYELLAQYPGKTGLHLLAYCGKTGLMPKFLETYNVNKRDRFGHSPISYAVHNARFDAIRLLVDNGAKLDGFYIFPDYQDKISEFCPGQAITLLTLVIYKGSPELLSLLISIGAPVNAVDMEGKSALHYAVHHLEYLFRSAKGRAYHIYADGEIPRSVKEMLHILFDAGADTSKKDNSGRTPLSYATGLVGFLGNYDHGEIQDILVNLLACGVSPNDCDKDGKSVFMYAAESDARLTKQLISYGVQTTQVDHYGRTALFYAASGRQKKVMSLLLESGFSVYHEDLGGRTALSYIAKSHRDICRDLHIRQTAAEILMSKGLNADHVDNQGRTPMYHVIDDLFESRGQIIESHCQEFGELLFRTNVNHRDYEGRTLLFNAAEGGNCCVVALLLALGCNRHHISNKGETALRVAKNMSVKSLLISWDFEFKGIYDASEANLIGQDLCRILEHWSYLGVRSCIVQDLPNRVQFLVMEFHSRLQLFWSQHNKNHVYRAT